MSSLNADLDTLELAMRSFFQVMKRPQRWAEIAADAGVALDRPAAIILQTILHNAGMNRVQDVADLLGIEAPSVTRKTQELERLGYLRRVPSKTDGRAINLEVTAVGRTASQRLHEVQRNSISRVISQWSAEDRAQFAKLLERFSSDLKTN